MADVQGHRPAGLDSKDTAQRLCGVIEELVSELYPGRRGRARVSTANRIDRDLAIDSLGRAELLRRIERTFGVSLPDELLGTAETVGDLLAGLQRQMPGTVRVSRSVPVHRGAEEPAATPHGAETLIEVIEAHASSDPERTHILLTDVGPEPTQITYGALTASARQVAGGLRERGVSSQDRVAIMLPTCAEFFDSFFGSLYAGAVPVPIYPPMRMSQVEEHVRRQASILRNAEARVLITVPEALKVARLLRALVPSLDFVGTVDDLKQGAEPVDPAPVRADDMALLQYTSGSTGDPKGVMLTHRNLLANLRGIGEVLEPSGRDTLVSWLPLYHDMGLIGAWLGGLYFAVPLVLMSPLTFLARPEKWLWAIHHHRATISAAPNFAFEICATKIEDDQIEGLDLSSLRVLMNGAEPVSASSIRKFSERFGPYGLRADVIAPVYGIAENSLALAMPASAREPRVDRIRREPFVSHGQAVAATDDDALQIVSCGRTLPLHNIRIVDAGGRELGERQEGRIQFRGPSATSGYFRNQRATRELKQHGWLESGDRGYLADGEIYVTGRSKDILIRAGRNIHPHEVEEAVGEIEGVRKGCVAVFGAGMGDSGTEKIVVVAETRLEDDAARAAIRSVIESIGTQLMDARPDEVVLAPPHTIPKTSSGKIRRSATRERYEQGVLTGGSRAVWRQVLSLSFSAVRSRASGFLRAAGRRTYGVYWWLAILGSALGAWVFLLLARTPTSRWKAVRTSARIILALTFTKATMEGEEHLPSVGGVLAINHASYFDSIVISALVPGPLSFVVKDDLSQFKFFRSFLDRMGALFVQRLDTAASLEDTGKVVQAARAGRRIAVFPEGTFLPGGGLLPFRLGAFTVAAETQTPVIPVALRGTRQILRDEEWIPNRGSVHLKILPAIAPRGADFQEAIRLRNAAREAILPHCGEPDRSDDRVIFTAAGPERV